MLQKKHYYVFYCLLFIAIGCGQRTKEKKIVYAVVNDSAYVQSQIYSQEFDEWKRTYETCEKTPLFKDAIYIGLQKKFGIGDITNISAQVANGRIKLLDTTFVKNFYGLIKSNNISNCYTKLPLSKDLRNQLLAELTNVLSQSGNYKYINDLIDTTGITFGITTLSDNSLIPDSIVNLLQHTTDSSLLKFKKILLTPGNVMLTRGVIISGYFSEFSVKDKMPPTDLTNFSTEQFFKTGSDSSTASIKLLRDYKLRILVNRYYTIFGELYSFKEVPEQLSK